MPQEWSSAGSQQYLLHLFGVFAYQRLKDS